MLPFLLLSLSCAFGFASEPRLDLYKQIKRETGVSLKEAYQAVVEGNRNVATDLQIYARRAGIEPIERTLDEEILERKNDCKRRSAACNESVSDLENQLGNLRSMHRDFNKLSAPKQIYFSLLVYGFNIKFKVLKTELEDWSNSCGLPEKINTRPCQEKLYEVHTLADIANDLTIFELGKIQGAKVMPEARKSIMERISRYEK